MRNIVILSRVAGLPESRVFKDEVTQNAILCTFNRDFVCTPDCAACELIGCNPGESKAICQRKEAGFEIGRGLVD